MERRGLILSVILILIAAMLSSQLTKELTGMSTASINYPATYNRNTEFGSSNGGSSTNTVCPPMPNKDKTKISVWGDMWRWYILQAHQDALTKCENIYDNYKEEETTEKNKNEIACDAKSPPCKWETPTEKPEQCKVIEPCKRLERINPYTGEPTGWFLYKCKAEGNYNINNYNCDDKTPQ